MNLTGLHFGSYWMGRNDVVYLMAQDLSKITKTHLIDTEIYSSKPNKWFHELANSKQGFPIRVLDDELIIEKIESTKSNFIVVNAGGMTISSKMKDILKKRKIISIGIELSDPDVYEDNGKAYSDRYDLFYTNSLFSINNQYPQTSRYHWLPFAASPSLHRPLKEVKKKFDVVVVGHARPDRLDAVAELRKHFSVGTFGKGWGEKNTEVHGIQHVRAINSGKIYLSFSKTYAGYDNVKVGLFEAAACRTMVMTSHSPELSRLFTFGIDLIGFTDTYSLVKTTDYYLTHPIEREWIAENGYRRILTEHTWKKRWKGVLSDISKIRKLS